MALPASWPSSEFKINSAPFDKKMKMMKTFTKTMLILGLLAPMRHINSQGIKGTGGLSGNSAFSQQFSSTNQQVPVAGQQLSSSFIQMFNALTPVQQQQFIRQMSSSNRRIFQQAIQPQSSSSFFNEEVSSSSGGGAGTGGVGGGSFGSFGRTTSSTGGGGGFGSTKSAFSKQLSSTQQVLSPVQQAFFKSQQSRQSFVQPTIQPVSNQFSFSRQVSSQVQQPQQVILPTQSSANEFQSSRQVIVQPQPQQQSFFNSRVEQVKQVAQQPVVLPSSEQSFRKVQSFTSQPLPVQTTGESGFTSQQFVQQAFQQPQPQTSSFNRFQQQQFSSSGQPITTGFNTNQFSSSSSSNLADGGFGGSGSGFGGLGGLGGGGGGSGSSQFSSSSTGGFGGLDASSLQQEKLDAGSFGGVGGIGGAGGDFSSQNQFVQSNQGGLSLPGGFDSSSLNSISSSSGGGFDSSDAQQKNTLGTSGGIPDEYLGGAGGLTAASINSKWYIMKPVENPGALGLGDARAASGSLRQIPASRALEAQSRSSSSGSSSSSTSSPSASGSSTTSTSSPKKRAASTSREDKRKANEEISSASSSSSLLEPDESSGVGLDETDENRRRR